MFWGSLGDGELLGLVLNNSTITNQLLFQTSLILFCKVLLPVRDVTLSSLDLYPSGCVVLLEELDFDDGLQVESLDIIALFGARNGIGFDSDSDMLLFLGGLVVIHYVVGLILGFGQFPLLFKLVKLNILLEIVPDMAWLDEVGENVI